MAGFSTDKDRKVIPRWRTLDETLRLRELDSVGPPRTHQKIATDFLAQKKWEWRQHQTVGHATDLVGAALTLGREREVTGAARFLLQDDLNVSPWVRELAEQAFKTPDDVETATLSPEVLEKQTLYARVRTFRSLLRAEPKDPITWVELSLAYAILGLGEQAERSMTVALQLAMNNRFVLRSAGRLWIYLEDPEKAHDIIVRADRTTHDPWLLAAEIAIGSAAGRKPRFIKAARWMLTEGHFSPIHISELASAVATLELGSGNVRKSKKLFGRSLLDPTENSIAQAAWASRQHNIAIRFNDQYLRLHNAFEAESWIFCQKGQWEQAVEQCKLWQFDQLFSSRPGVLGSYVSAIALEDYSTSERFADRGLMANPSNFTLLNNLAFARINLGNMEGAREALSRVDCLQLSDRDQAVLQATQGLLKFRTGNVARGRELYSDARSKAKKMQNEDGRRLLALASVFHAIEEMSQEVSDNGHVLFEAFQALKRMHDPIFRVLEHKLAKLKSSKETDPLPPTG